MVHASTLQRTVVLTLIAVTRVGSVALAQESGGVESRPVEIYSGGTKLAGDLHFPSDLVDGRKLPAIVLCHGWGGVKSHLNQTYGPAFAAQGYVVLAFDYRGWGESDSRLVLVGDTPEPDTSGRATATVRMIRELVDPFDQLEDIQAALNFLEGESMVDTSRIGLWGTSFGGGLVVWTAAHDARVKVLVSQVGAMDGRSAAAAVGLRLLHQEEIARARGELDPVPQGEHTFPGLRGTPYLSKFARYAPVEHVDQLTVPTLLIDAENEELFDRREHSQLVHERIKDRLPSRYHVEPGITHYGIYRERYAQGVKLALEWFDEYLKSH